ncbi:TPA: hypothetical protein HA295_01055 [Candidatus Woesearchaeota archaeon]|nr:hypothetical protein [Candidatus Woesearchaeota archaeon]
MGGFLQSAQYGSIRSVVLYAALHFSHTSPYWSPARHFGHFPLTYLSGKALLSCSQ